MILVIMIVAMLTSVVMPVFADNEKTEAINEAKASFADNYHLHAKIDGKAYKYILRMGTKDHNEITETGLSNLTEETMEELVSRYLLPKVGLHFT